MRILIAAGGTGGHIYPALAVVRRLRDEHPAADIHWLGGRRGLETDLVPGAGIPLERLWLRSLRTVDVSLHALADPARLVASAPQAVALMARWRPDAVYTTGGSVAMPVLAAAATLRVPSLVWEGNRIPGRSVRASARLATLRAVTFETTRRSLPEPCVTTGTPIRRFGSLDRGAARAAMGVPEGLPVLLVFGGSQAVARLNAAVADAVTTLVERCTVIHVCGPSGLAAAEATRGRLDAGLQDRYRPYAWLGDEMAQALLCADVLVGRAGSSTLAEAAAIGLPMVIVPYPHAAAHQAANAREMVEAGAALTVRDDRFDGPALMRAADLLFDDRRERMSRAARGLGRPGAATATVRLLEALTERRALPAAHEVDAWTRLAA
jgi:UDP-N-acetylglucosamine--N-acetylmuramyl-(pentapeptide) pyrophosphoryl-undecaprenol N-acetylglucosamine transferase